MKRITVLITKPDTVILLVSCRNDHYFGPNRCIPLIKKYKEGQQVLSTFAERRSYLQTTTVTHTTYYDRNNRHGKEGDLTLSYLCQAMSNYAS